MATIAYTINSGDPVFTASLSPAVVEPNIHASIGTYYFSGIPEGIYTLTIEDSNGCKNTQEVTTIGYTTTTTTTSTTTTSTTTTTTTQYVLPPCQRPAGLSTFTLINGYYTPSTEISVYSYTSSVDACSAIEYMLSFGGEYVDVQWLTLSIQAYNLGLFSHVYLNNGTNNCDCIPDGWYFTEFSANSNKTMYHIVGCTIVEILSCDCLIANGQAQEVICDLYGIIAVIYPI